jgi:DNA-binding HxlR family transcriptional regulator
VCQRCGGDKRHIDVCIQEKDFGMTHITNTKCIPPGGAVREVLDRIGDKWSLLVIGALRDGPMRFGALAETVEGISQRMLTLTLKHLVEDGLVDRTAYAEVPPRVEYELTELGRTLLPLVMSLAKWAMAHRDEINANRTSR